MNPIATQKVALNNALVAPEKRLKIEKCNARIEFSKPQRKETYQVTLDALKLSPCYPAFLITAEVLEVYMHQFWNTIKKIKDTDAYQFKLDKKKFRINTEVFHEILHICPRLPNQKFVEPSSEDEMVSFIKDLGYTGKCDMLFEIHTDHMHQPCRTFVAVINRCISGKSTGLDRLRPSRAQILWGMFNQKNVDYYGALNPEEMINQDIKDSKAYKTYLAFATGQATPKKARKFNKIASPSKKLSRFLEEEKEATKKPKRAKKPAKKSSIVPIAGVVIKDTLGVSVLKKKAPAKVDRGKGMDLLSDVALLEVAQLKKTLKKSKLETHKLHASGLGDGVGSQPKVPHEQQDKTTGTNEGTGTKPGVLDVPKDQSKNDVSNDDDDVVDSDAYGDNEASSEKTDSDKDGNPNLNQNDDEEEEYVRTPENYEFSNDDEEYEELYKDVNVRLKDAKHEEEGKRDAEKTDAGRDDKTEGPMQSSSILSDFANQFLNLDNAPPVDNEFVSMMNFKVRHEEQTSQEVIGSVLMAERNKVQRSIYFFSKVLRDAQVNYPPLEKLVFALLLSSRRFKWQNVKMGNRAERVRNNLQIQAISQGANHGRLPRKGKGWYTAKEESIKAYLDQLRTPGQRYPSRGHQGKVHPSAIEGARPSCTLSGKERHLNHGAKQTVSIGLQLYPTIHKPMVMLRWPTRKLSRPSRNEQRNTRLLG
ncbi:retrovirus-related pol polyprotein from transposon TNT 1-94, partial [Tanacetum coccineum]